MDLDSRSVKQWLHKGEWTPRTIKKIMDLSDKHTNTTPLHVLVENFGIGITNEIYHTLTKNPNLKQKSYQVTLHPKWERVYKVQYKDKLLPTYNAVLVKKSTWFDDIDSYEFPAQYIHREEVILCEPDDKFTSYSISEAQTLLHIFPSHKGKYMAYSIAKQYEDMLNEEHSMTYQI